MQCFYYFYLAMVRNISHTPPSRKNRTLRYLAFIVLLAPLLYVAYMSSDALRSEINAIAKRVQSAFFKEEKPQTTSSYYLQAQFAEQEADIDLSAELFTKAFAQSEDAEQKTILANNAVESSILAGDIDEAFSLLPDSAEDDFLAVFLRYIEAATQNDATALATALDAHELATHFPEITEFLLPAVTTWQSKMEDPTADITFPVTGEKQLRRYSQYQKRLFNARHNIGDMSEAAATLAANNQPMRFIEAAVRLHQKAGNYVAAETLMQHYVSGTLPFKPQPDLEAIYNPKLHLAISHPVLDNRSNAMQPILAELLLDMAEYALQSQQVRKAVIYAQLSFHLNPNRQYTTLILADIFNREENYEKAISYLEEVPNTSLSYWNSQLKAANMHYTLGDEKTAKFLLNNFSKNNPTLHNGVLSLADIYMGEKRFRDAANLYQSVIDKTETNTHKNWPVLYAAAMCYDQIDEWGKAEPLFLEALRIVPNQPDVLNYLGYSWLIRNKNINEAETMLKKAIQLSPNAAHIIDSYGWALFKLERYDEALNYLEYANLLIPHDATINDHVGDVYWKLGRFREATWQWNRALSFKPPAEDAMKIKRKLKDGYQDDSES